MNGRIIPLSLPKWGLLMTEGTLSAWRAPVGTHLAAGEVVADIESEKIVNEFAAHEPGILRRQLIQAGETCAVGTLIGVMTEGDVSDAELDAFLAALLTSDTAAEVNISDAAPRAQVAPAAGGAERAGAGSLVTAVRIPAALRGTGSSANVRATHHAIALAQLWGVDLTQIRGTGNARQITKSDLLAAITSAGGTIDAVAARVADHGIPPPDADRPATPARAVSLPVLEWPLSSLEPLPGDRRIRKAAVLAAARENGPVGYVEQPLSGSRRVIARRVSESMRTAPHFRLVMDIRIDELLALGETLSRKSGIKVSLNDLLVAATAHALTAVDGVNIHVLDDRIRQFQDADIAIAVSTANGLITPVVRAANTKGILEIATEAHTLTTKAREGRLSSEEVEGGTFTISNLGMFGVREFDAIINPPQGAILAIGAAQRRKLLTDAGTEIAATVVTVTMSCDHRAIDGVLGARFLQVLKALTEAPAPLEDPRATRTYALGTRAGSVA